MWVRADARDRFTEEEGMRKKEGNTGGLEDYLLCRSISRGRPGWPPRRAPYFGPRTSGGQPYGAARKSLAAAGLRRGKYGPMHGKW